MSLCYAVADWGLAISCEFCLVQQTCTFLWLLMVIVISSHMTRVCVSVVEGTYTGRGMEWKPMAATATEPFWEQWCNIYHKPHISHNPWYPWQPTLTISPHHRNGARRSAMCVSVRCDHFVEAEEGLENCHMLLGLLTLQSNTFLCSC